MATETSLVGRLTSVAQAAQRMWDCCKSCSLKNSVFVPAQLTQDAAMLFIGEAPGKEEAAQGVPFVGQSGKLLRNAIEKLQLGTYSISNVVKCHPTAPTGENRAPTPTEIRHCAPMIAREASLYDFIILVGGTALGSVFPGSGLKISEVVGTALLKGQKKYYVIYHPAYILRTREAEPDWWADIERITSYLDGSAGITYTFPQTLDEVESALQHLAGSPRLYVDIETSSKDLFDFQMLSIGLGDETSQVVIDFTPELAEKLNRIIFTPGREVVIHNSLFELTHFKAVGIDLTHCKILDTMVMAYMLDESRRYSGFGQKELARKLLGYKYWYMLGDYDAVATVPQADLRAYNAEDIVVMRKLFQHFWGKLTDKQRHFFMAVLSDAFKAIADIMVNGVAVDLPGLATYRKSLQGKMEVLLSELELDYGKINWNSASQVADWLQAKGVTEGQKTPKGLRLAVTADSLQQIGSSSSDSMIRGMVERLLKYRSLGKLDSTFLEAISTKVGLGGRVRSEYNFTNTVTGRLSSSNPSFHTWPRNGGVRQLFIASPGYKLIEGDFSQVELRVMAAVAPEPVMIEVFNNKGDIHRVTASIVMKKPPEQITEDERYKAKAVNFGFLYGAGWETFQLTARTEYEVEFSEQQARQIRVDFFSTYKGLTRYHQQAEEQVNRLGYVESPFGRIRHLADEIHNDNPGVRSHAVRQAINSPIQSAASDLMLAVIGWIAVHKGGVFAPDEVRLVGTIHDQLLLEVKEESIATVLPWLNNAMAYACSLAPWMTVPLIMDWKVGTRWGQLEKLRN